LQDHGFWKDWKISVTDKPIKHSKVTQFSWAIILSMFYMHLNKGATNLRTTFGRETKKATGTLKTRMVSPLILARRWKFVFSSSSVM
jgi:hypothetical protein